MVLSSPISAFTWVCWGWVICPKGLCLAPTTCQIWFWWALHLQPRRCARRGNITDLLHYSELTSSAPKHLPPEKKKRPLNQTLLQSSSVTFKQSHPVSSPRLLTHSWWSTPAWTGRQRAGEWFCIDSTERRTAADSFPMKTESSFQLELHLPAETHSRVSLSEPRRN